MGRMTGSDRSIIRAVLDGDKDAYAALVQEAFLRGYQKLDSFQQNSSFGTWIYRIAVNCALNRMSRPGIEAEYRHGEESDPEEKTVQVAGQDADPERVLLSGEISAIQEMAMQRLTPTEKSAFVLRHFEDRSMNEIAEVLGIAPNTAKQTVFRAVQKLRRELAPLRGSA